MKIWCVEDDAGIRDIIAYTLTSTGFETSGFPDADACLRALADDTPDLILLDVMLPGMDGVALLKCLKENRQTASIPVIMATAKGLEIDKVRSLDMGADDYLVKPFGMMEMVSRIRAVLRRCAPKEVETVRQIDELTLNPEEHLVLAQGEEVILTYKEYELLKLFMENPRRVFSREQLLDRVWDMSYMGDTRTVDVHIQTLRQKLGACGSLIQTVRGVGYCLREKSK